MKICIERRNKRRFRTMKLILGILTALFLFYPVSAEAQLNKLKKKVSKAVKKEIKPLELDFKVTKIKYNPLKSPGKVSLNVLFEGYNPNKLGVKLDKVEFDLYIDNKFAAKFYNENKIEIPKQGNFSFKESADLNLKTVGKAVFNAIIKQKAVYRVDGTYYLKTKIGTFKLKAKLIEKEK